jgi:hypothetical protein
MIRALLVINAVLALHYAAVHPHPRYPVCFASSSSCRQAWQSVVCFAQDGQCAKRALNAFAVPPQASPRP